jgi:hypothetical protein
LIANIVNKNVSAKKLSRKKSLSEQIFKQAGIFNKILTFFSLSFWRGLGRGFLLQLLYNKLGSKFGCMINILRESMIIHVKNVQFATCP